MMAFSKNTQSINVSNPTALFVYFIAGYVGLLVMAYLGNSWLLKGLSFLVAFLFFITMATVSLYLPRVRYLATGYGMALALALYYYGFVGSILFNMGQTDWGVVFKALMTPLFLVFGAKFESQGYGRIWHRRDIQVLFLMLILLPFVLWLWQLAKGLIELGGLGGVSIFANRNNAGLYAVSLIALYNVLSGRPVRNPLIYIAAGMVFGTIGVLLSIIIAMMVLAPKETAFKTLAFLLVAALGISVVYATYPKLGFFARFEPVMGSLQLLFNQKINLETVTYGQLVGLLHTTDLSFLFRLKHWLDLKHIFLDGTAYDWVFGYGVGASERMSEMHLVPHNDYLRYIFETGVVTFLGFVALVIQILYTCGRRWETVPLMAIILYFFSENLIDNFMAMSIFYFCAGALSWRIRDEAANA